MKNRSGFVSNSSTSSFIIIGAEANLDDLIDQYGEKKVDKMQDNNEIISDDGECYIGEYLGSVDDEGNSYISFTKSEIDDIFNRVISKYKLNPNDVQLHIGMRAC